MHRPVPTGLAANGGSIASGVYTNSIYRFSLQVPPGWAVVPSSEGQNISSAQGEPGHQVNRVLLIMTENAPRKKNPERKSLQIIATRLNEQPGPTAAEGFITYSERIAKEKGLPVKYKGLPKKLTIHDQPFSKISLTLTTDGQDQRIEQYVTTRAEVLLQFLLISPTDEGLKELQPVIQSLQFKAGEPATTAK
jgi:hypothetical protein